MSMNAVQKNGLIERAMQIARQMGDLKKVADGLANEFTAEGGAATLIATGDLTNYGPSAGLTGTEFSDGVTAIANCVATMETNKTNLFKIAIADSTP